MGGFESPLRKQSGGLFSGRGIAPCLHTAQATESRALEKDNENHHPLPPD